MQNKLHQTAAALLVTASLLFPQTNVAPFGKAYTWAHNLDPLSDANKVECPELNDNDPDSVIWLSRTPLGEAVDDTINAWQAAGVVWEGDYDITEVVYVNGPYDGTVYANGAFSKEGSFHLQITRDGTTWESTEIKEDPEYTYFSWESAAWGALVSDEAFSFKGPIGIVRGVRVTGCVHNWEAGSWNASCRQIMAYGTPTRVKNKITTVPAGFTLQQNYPNPFNAGTQITFYLPKQSFVKLMIFDVNGRVVDRLIEGTLEAGRFTVQWKPQQGEGTSGIYLARLIAVSSDQTYTRTIKMSMIK
ncbi:MAG: T9SS type A sorting domain-containing protein [candidate division KSB1 bacterium]|nr:T9SS type A sorting domain-containing protein [candidate division KSB1 bacterium]